MLQGSWAISYDPMSGERAVGARQKENEMS